MRILMVAVLALAACATSTYPAWHRSDIALEATFLVALAVDWAQSGKFVAQCREENPVIGRCGDRLPLNAWIPLSAFIHFAITAGLPPGRVRTAWLGLTTGLELDTVYVNAMLDRR